VLSVVASAGDIAQGDIVVNVSASFAGRVEAIPTSLIITDAAVRIEEFFNVRLHAQPAGQTVYSVAGTVGQGAARITMGAIFDDGTQLDNLYPEGQPPIFENLVTFFSTDPSVATVGTDAVVTVHSNSARPFRVFCSVGYDAVSIEETITLSTNLEAAVGDIDLVPAVITSPLMPFGDQIVNQPFDMEAS